MGRPSTPLAKSLIVRKRKNPIDNSAFLEAKQIKVVIKLPYKILLADITTTHFKYLRKIFHSCAVQFTLPNYHILPHFNIFSRRINIDKFSSEQASLWRNLGI